MEENFIDLLFKTSGVDREEYSAKKKEIDAFLKKQFNSFLKDNRIKINENLIKLAIKDELEYFGIKEDHIDKITSIINRIHLEVLINYYYPNMPVNLKKHILNNSYAHRLNEKRLKQLKLFLGDKSKSIKYLKPESIKELKDNSIKFLINYWNNPEFHPFYNVKEAEDKLIAVKTKYGIFIKIMRLSSSESFKITFTHWLAPKYTFKGLKKIYGRHLNHSRVNVKDDIHKVSKLIVKIHQLNSFNDLKKKEEDGDFNPYSILTGLDTNQNEENSPFNVDISME